MSDVSSRWFGDAASSGVYRIGAANGYESAVADAALDVVRISLEGTAEKGALLAAVATALSFPEWFGKNWDALEDCLTDLSWRPAAGRLLLFEGHARIPPDALETFIDILRSAAGYWASRRVAFFAVFIDPHGELALPELER